VLIRDVHSALRRSPAWPRVQNAYAWSGPRACAAVHTAVCILGHHGFPADAVLKHRYDYEPVEVPPAQITGTLEVAAWQRTSGRSLSSQLERTRAWLRFGGGWKSCQRHITRTFHGGFVLHGGWDRAIEAFRPREVIEQLFVENRAPAETDEYRYLEERIEARRFANTHGCHSIDDLERYFAAMISAYSSIRDHGYRSQLELGNDPSDEIRVCVDRHGALAVFGGGTHRLSMALSLGVPRVPVIIKRVHAGWVGLAPEDGRLETISKVEAAVATLTSPR
jgi:hypothetical protein